MKKLTSLTYAIFLSPCLVFSTFASASTSFDTKATLGFSVQSISNLTAPGNPNPGDVSIDVGFEYQDENRQAPHASWLLKTGDASLVISGANEVIQGAFDSTAASFAHSFSVVGNVSSGNMETYQLGWYHWTLTNNSATDSYALNLNFNCLLEALTVGDFANAIVSLDYFSDDDASFSGFAEIESSNLVTPSLQTEQALSWLLTLAPGESRHYLVDVAIRAGAVAEVPLPAAIWSFLAGIIGLLGMTKRKFADI